MEPGHHILRAFGCFYSSQFVFVDVFSKILSATRCETLQKLYLHVAREPLRCSHSSLADSWQWRHCCGEHCHQRALGGPQQTVNWRKLGEITVLILSEPQSVHLGRKTQAVGSRRWTRSRRLTEKLQGLPAFRLRTERAGRLSEGESRLGTDQTLQIPDGCPGLLCKKERRGTPSSTGLPRAEHHDREEQVPAPADSGTDRKALRSKVFHEVRRPPRGHRAGNPVPVAG